MQAYTEAPCPLTKAGGVRNPVDQIGVNLGIPPIYDDLWVEPVCDGGSYPGVVPRIPSVVVC